MRSPGNESAAVPFQALGVVVTDRMYMPRARHWGSDRSRVGIEIEVTVEVNHSTPTSSRKAPISARPRSTVAR